MTEIDWDNIPPPTHHNYCTSLDQSFAKILSMSREELEEMVSVCENILAVNLPDTTNMTTKLGPMKNVSALIASLLRSFIYEHHQELKTRQWPSTKNWQPPQPSLN
jgi:hypothetical protein